MNQVLRTLIHESERKGTWDVRPHASILKGELIDRVLVKFLAFKNNWGQQRLEKTLFVQVYSSATVWEFKQAVARELDLIPKYLQFELATEVLTDDKNGMTISETGIASGDILTARRLILKEDVEAVTVVDFDAQRLDPRAAVIFAEWFDLYKNPETGLMDNEGVAKFISRATNHMLSKNDAKVASMIQEHDSDGDRCLTLDDFLRFYYDAGIGPDDKQDAIGNNLKYHSVRCDLVRLRDVIVPEVFTAPNMPRNSLSSTQDEFNCLM
jgi:hypothetical protein